MEGRYARRSRYGENGGSVRSRVLAKEDSSRISEDSKSKKSHQVSDARAFRNAEGVKSRMSKFSSGVNSTPLKSGSSRLGDVTTQKKEIEPRRDSEGSNVRSKPRRDILKRHDRELDDVNNNDVIKSPLSNGSKYSIEKMSVKSVSNGDRTKHIESSFVKKEWSGSDTKVSVVETSVETTVDEDVESDESGIDSMISSTGVTESTKTLLVDNEGVNDVPQDGAEESDSVNHITKDTSHDLQSEAPAYQKVLEDNCQDDVINEDKSSEVTNDDVTSPTTEDSGDLISAFAVKSTRRDRESKNNNPLRTLADGENEEKGTRSTSDDNAQKKRQQRHSNSGLAVADDGKGNVENDDITAKNDVSENNNAKDKLSLGKLGEGSATIEASAAPRRRRRVRNSDDSSRSSKTCSLASTPDGNVESLIVGSPNIKKSSIASTPESPSDLSFSVSSQSSTGDPGYALVNDTKKVPTELEKVTHVTDDEAHDKVFKKKEDFADVTDEVRANNKTKTKEEFDIKPESPSTTVDNNSTSTRIKSLSRELSTKAEATDYSDKIEETQSEVKVTEEEKSIEVELQVEVTKEDPPAMRYTLDNLEQCTEEAILQKLLGEADQYEDRKKIRAALRVLRKAQADGVVMAPKQTSSTKWKSQTISKVTTDKNNSQMTKKTTIVTTKCKETTTPSSGWKSRVKSPQDADKAPADPKSLAAKYGLTSQTKRDMSSGKKKVGSIFDREEEAPKKSSGRLDIERRQAERRKEITRNRSMPASSSKDARKMFVAKLEGESGGTKGSKKVGKSPSFVVPNANNIKQMLLKWCQAKTRGYKHVDINNYSSSWADGMAFCALVHNFFPDAFDYSELDPKNRAKNFDLAFTMAEKHAEAAPLLEVEDMMIMGNRPDSKCVFTYVQSLYGKLKKFDKSAKPQTVVVKVKGGETSSSPI